MRTYRFKINEGASKTLTINFTPPVGALAARCVATNSSGNATTLPGAVVVNGSNLEFTVPSAYATYGNFPAKFEIQLQVNGGPWYTEVEAYGGLVATAVDSTESVTSVSGLIKKKTDVINRVRNIGGYRATSRKCPITKAVVSVSLAYDGYSGGGAVVKLASMPAVAECNFKQAHLFQQVQANYNHYGILTGPWNTGDTVSTIQPAFNGKNMKAIDVTFMFEGTHINFTSVYIAGAWAQDTRIWIDDEEIENWYLGNRATGVLQNKSTITPSSLGTGTHCYSVNFATRGLYKVRIHGLLLSMGGATTEAASVGNFLTIGPNSRVIKPAPRANVGVISDSFFESIGSNTSMSASSALGTQLNANIWNYAQSGSGFVNPSGGGTYGDKSYASNLVWDAVGRGPSKLDLLIINGSANDMSYTDSQVAAAMRTTFDRARAFDPNIPIVWVGIEPLSYYKGIFTPSAMKARETYLMSVAASDPNVVMTIPMCNEEWINGTGKVGATTNDGNQDFVIGSDGVHLSPYGTEYIGRLIAERIGSALLGGN